MNKPVQHVDGQIGSDPIIDPDPRATHPIGTAIEIFVEELRGLREVMPLLSTTAKDAEEDARKQKQDELLRTGLPILEDDRVKALPGRRRLSAGMRTKLLHHQVAATGLLHAERDLGSAMLLMMSAHFDRFVGDMVRAAFEIKPEMRKALRREISFSDLADLPSIDAVQDLVVEKEIEIILHGNRASQIKWFESRCGMREFDRGLAAELSDVAELRNLIAHHGGEVTNRVGFGLRSQKTKLLRPYKAGDSIFVTKEHIDLVHDILFTAAIAISQGVWRNLREDQRPYADHNFHALTYARLALEEFGLARRALLLGIKFRETMSLSARLVNTVNLAQTYKWLGDQDGCDNVLGSEDWEEHEEPFRLAVAVLNDEWESARVLMEKCAKENLVDRAEFEDWPVFRQFRKTEHFRSAFERAYPT